MNPSSHSKSVCLVHDWLIAMRGGEKVLEALTELFPDAPIYTLFANRKKLSRALAAKRIHTSFLQLIPGIEKIYRYLLPFFPLAIKTLDTSQYDIVISSSHCVAKAAQKKQGAKSVCYCHTPMRYLWNFHEEYFGSFPSIIRKMIGLYLNHLKKWDVKTSRNVDLFIANSRNTADKIKTLYDAPSTVIHAPVDETPVQFLSPQKNYYLLVSAFVQYKRIDLAIEAFNKLKRPLIVIGDGPLKNKIQKLVTYDEIQFMGWVPVNELWDRYSRCKALIFPGEEDFGIVPLEAQMFGKPVIAFGKGGALETVLPSSTGVFFDQATVESLVEAVKKADHVHFDPIFIRNHALTFVKGSFKEKIAAILKNLNQ